MAIPKMRDASLIHKEIAALGGDVDCVKVSKDKINVEYNTKPTGSIKTKIDKFLKTGKFTADQRIRPLIPKISEMDEIEIKDAADKFKQMKECYEKIYGKV